MTFGSFSYSIVDMDTLNIDKKSQLAKLLATENIEVQENAVKTASFDVKDRILTIPIFKEEERSKHIYDMLVGHEVSHALHTPSDGWMNMKDRTQEFRSFVNVIAVSYTHLTLPTILLV